MRYVDDNRVFYGGEIVTHDAVLSAGITLYVTPFHEMEELPVRECVGDLSSLSRKRSAAKGNLKAAKGAKVKYTFEDAEAWKKKAVACELCGKSFGSYKEKHGDHSHKTGEWRGVLCANCNHALGHLKDSPELCEAAAAYLRKFEM